MRYRNVLVAAVVVALLAAGTAGAVLTTGSSGQTAQHAGDRTVTVSGDGSASAAPDRAVVVAAVVVEGDDPAAIRDDLATGAERLRSALEEAGVPDSQVTTGEYNIRENRPRRPDAEPDAQYRGVHAFEVELAGTDDTGAVVDAAAGAGAEIQTVRFTLSAESRDELRDEALTSAMADAERQADTIADASDLRVTGVASVDATSSRVRPFALDVAAAESADGGTAIESGDVSVSASVTVVYNATG
jgi:uncharacterized protein YggE